MEDQFGLPPTHHIPGTGSVASLEFLQQVSGLTPHQTVSDAWQSNVPYRYGWYLFFRGYYWESHEIWERVWLNCGHNSREKRVMQALIQLANAKLKSVQGNAKTAQKIQRMAADLISEAFSGFQDDTHFTIMGLKQRDLLELSQDNAL